MKLPISKCGASLRGAEAQRRFLHHRILSASPRLRAKTSLAFSLIEVVLAVGVISFALVGIIGLFPVAMQSALDSQRETQVAFIARSLFSELQRVNGEKAYVTETQPGKSLEEGTAKTVDLSNPTSGSPPTFFFNVDGQMVTSATDATYSASIKVDRTGQPAGLSRVDVEIAVPANAPTVNQKKYNFVTLINFTPSATP
jgi:uncharacterized protein (TIGR02598 family)